MIREHRTRRLLEVTATVAIWVTVSMVFHLQRGHLLLGVPITAAFQLGVRRQPLRALWVRDGGPFRLDAQGWLLAVLLGLYPGYRLVVIAQAGAPIGKIALSAAAAVGAIPAAYALRSFRRPMLRPMLLCLAIGGGIGVLIVVLLALGGGLEHRSLLERIQLGVDGMLRYLPIGFVVEEVSFRGAFDAHLYHPGESRGVLTAVFGSALWGLWHVPGTAGQLSILIAIPALVVVHCLLGVPLAIFWRRSGNLLVPASAHALSDAVRNALLGAPS
jgi:membrane protease YdiL (CAAX protease family)